MADQFVFRDLWITVKSEIEKALGKKENNGVYLGKDGYLIQKFVKPEARDVTNRIQAVNNFDRLTPNIPKFFMLVPTAGKVLKNKLPDYVTEPDELMYIDKVKQSMNRNISFVDLYQPLSSKKEEPIFYKTDHHWTTRGAFYAYQELGKQMGFVPHDEGNYNLAKITDEFYGTLYSKSGFRNIDSDRIELYVQKKKEQYIVEYKDDHKRADSVYVLDHVRKKDKYAVFLNGNHPLVKITTGNKKRGKLLVIKDSYANCFIPFLIAHFSEIYVVDLRYYEENINRLLQNYQINEILLLYNIDTFFQDPSILYLSKEEK